MERRMEVLASLPGAAVLEKVHADGDVVVGVKTHPGGRVCKLAVAGLSGTHPPLELTTNLHGVVE